MKLFKIMNFNYNKILFQKLLRNEDHLPPNYKN